jgi:hypothetical protein
MDNVQNRDSFNMPSSQNYRCHVEYQWARNGQAKHLKLTALVHYSLHGSDEKTVKETSFILANVR